MLLNLERSKIDMEYTSVQIILAVTGKKKLSVLNSQRLFMQHLQPLNNFLFDFSSATFLQFSIFSLPMEMITEIDLLEAKYWGDSFRNLRLNTRQIILCLMRIFRKYMAGRLILSSTIIPSCWSCYISSTWVFKRICLYQFPKK